MRFAFWHPALHYLVLCASRFLFPTRDKDMEYRLPTNWHGLRLLVNIGSIRRNLFNGLVSEEFDAKGLFVCPKSVNRNVMVN